MDMNDKLALDTLLADGADLSDAETVDVPVVEAPKRDFAKMMRKIPVTLTLEVGSTRLTLQDLMDIKTDSVVELDTLAGEPLVIKVNGTPIGHAEVVVSGENHGLKVIDLDGLDLNQLTA